MPPAICASSLSLSTLRQSCPAISITTRTFGCTPSRPKVGPESPKFIELPRPPQRYAIPRRDIKGTLPIPRNLFPKRAGNKTSVDYLANVTPEPTAERKLAEPPNEYTAWKRRMAATRRQNLRDGLIELHQRKVRADKTIALRSAIKQVNRALRVNAPQREDERLTASTVPAITRTLLTGHIPDPNREARLAAAAARLETKAAALAEKRRDALHRLYMHARDFIVTEAQLDEQIEKTFPDTQYQYGLYDNNSNIWDVEGPPTSVQTMLNEISNTQKTSINFYKSPAVDTGKRMRQIAEELTGGKMD